MRKEKGRAPACARRVPFDKFPSLCVHRIREKRRKEQGRSASANRTRAGWPYSVVATSSPSCKSTKAKGNRRKEKGRRNQAKTHEFAWFRRPFSFFLSPFSFCLFLSFWLAIRAAAPAGGGRPTAESCCRRTSTRCVLYVCEPRSSSPPSRSRRDERGRRQQR